MAEEIKLKGFGIKDMLYFSGKPTEREKFIQSTPARPLTVQYETNLKASERHPVQHGYREVLTWGAANNNIWMKILDLIDWGFFV